MDADFNCLLIKYLESFRLDMSPEIDENIRKENLWWNNAITTIQHEIALGDFTAWLVYKIKEEKEQE